MKNLPQTEPTEITDYLRQSNSVVNCMSLNDFNKLWITIDYAFCKYRRNDEPINLAEKYFPKYFFVKLFKNATVLFAMLLLN